ncbi:MFS transporter [Flindersiella endophytica]
MAGLGSAYGRLWTAGTLGSLGDGMYISALPMLAATLTSEPSLVSGVAVAVEAPWLVFGLLSGAIVDRVDRGRLASSATVVGGLLAAVLAVLVWSGHASITAIYVVAFAVGTCGTLSGTAAMTITPMVVAPAQLEQANGRLVGARVATGELAGPAVGGLLFGIGPSLPLAVHAAMSALSSWLFRSLRGPRAPSPGVRPAAVADVRMLVREMRDGMVWLFHHRRLRLVTILSVTFALTDSAWFALFPLYVGQILGLPVAAYGVLVGLGAFGGVLGGLAAARLTARIRSTGAILGTLMLSAAAAQVALALTDQTVLAACMLAVSSFAFAIWNVLVATAFQTLTPSELLGRVGSADRTAIMGASPLGALLGGIAATALGIRAAFLLGVPLLVGGALLAFSRLREGPSSPR